VDDKKMAGRELRAISPVASGSRPGSAVDWWRGGQSPVSADCCKVPGVLSFAGELSLRQSYHILNFCNALVTNDSAPLHLGMAADVYVFAIFGATVPAFGFAPFGEKGIVIEQHGLKCRPCGIHGGNVCPVKTFDCMIRTTPEDVFNKVSRTLGLENGLSEN
jgi:ADP-heptose:LPS heptosyltransferase